MWKQRSTDEQFGDVGAISLAQVGAQSVREVVNHLWQPRGQEGSSPLCNLYSVRTSRGALARKFGLSDNRMAAFEPLPAIFPGHMAPIIKQSADGERELVMRSWGF